jgi:hypothetical protein
MRRRKLERAMTRKGERVTQDAATEAIEDVEAALGPDVYYLVPRGDHFLGEMILAAVASILIQAALKGVEADITNQVEAWSKSARKWIKDRIASIVTDNELPDDSMREESARKTQAMLVQLRTVAAAEGVSTADLIRRLSSTEEILGVAFVDAGIAPATADRYRNVVGEATGRLLGSE